jgi:RNA polymerase sigma-70 factor, ECF subfamily
MPGIVGTRREYAILHLGAGYTRVLVDLGVQSGPTETTEPTVDRQAGPPSSDADVLLLDGVARADPKALEGLYERYSGAVFALSLRLLGDRPAAEEVVQETFLKLWRRSAAYQPSRGTLLVWLLGITHHHAVDVLRRRQIEQRHQAQEPVTENGRTSHPYSGVYSAPEADPLAAAGDAEVRRRILGALRALPDSQRIPLELAYYGGLTQAEIAARLGEPLGTVKTRMRLGLQRLRTAPGLAEVWVER